MWVYNGTRYVNPLTAYADSHEERTHQNCYVIRTLSRSRDSSVGIATGYVLDNGGVEVPVPVGLRIFSSLRRPDRLWGPPSLLSTGVKRPGNEADHSPTSAEVKKLWIYTSTPPYAFMALCLIS
jgi:hypothetical protein